MSPPSLRVLILGHPLVAALAIGMCGYVGWQAYVESIMGEWLVIMLCGWAAWQALKAFDHRRRHRAWRRDCMAIAGLSPSGTTSKRGRPLFAVALLLASWGGIIAKSDQPEQPVAIGIAIIAALAIATLAVWLTRLLWRALRHRPPKAKPNRPVTVAIRRPAMPVPSLRSAYAALPPYAQKLLKGRPQ